MRQHDGEVFFHLSGPEVTWIHHNSRDTRALAHANLRNIGAPPFKADADACKRQVAKFSHAVARTSMKTNERIVKSQNVDDLWHSPVAITKSSGVSL